MSTKSKTLNPLNPQAAKYVEEMITVFEKKKEQSLTLRTERFWQSCIDTLKENPNHFSSILENRYKHSTDFIIQRATVQEMALKLRSIQMKKWIPEN